MNTRLTIAVILTALMVPIWHVAFSQIDNPLAVVCGFLGYMVLIGYLISTGYQRS